MVKDERTPTPEIEARLKRLAAYRLAGLTAADMDRDLGLARGVSVKTKARYPRAYRREVYLAVERAWEIAQIVRMRTLGRLLNGAETALEVVDCAMRGVPRPTAESDSTQIDMPPTKEQSAMAGKWLSALEAFTRYEARPHDEAPQTRGEEEKPLTPLEKAAEEAADEFGLAKQLPAEPN